MSLGRYCVGVGISTSQIVSLEKSPVRATSASSRTADISSRVARLGPGLDFLRFMGAPFFLEGPPSPCAFLLSLPRSNSSERRSDRLDGICGYPDIDLLKSRLDPVFELLKELPAAGHIFNVYEDADQIVSILLALVFPKTANGLRL